MKTIKTIGLLIIITILQFIAMIISTQVIQFGPDFVLTPEEASQSALLLAFVSLINSSIIIYFFKRANNKDYKLLFWFIFIWFGIGTFMTQIETWYFIDAFSLLNNDTLMKIFLMGFINTCLIIPASFFIISSKSNETINIEIRKALNVKIIKSALFISVVYVTLYYLAGYFIAWQFDAIRMHYSGSLEKLSFFEHTISLLKTDPYFFPFQIFRGILWFFIGIPFFIILSKNRKECIIFSFFVFALLPSVQLFLPNPLMSEAVRMGHFIEGFISNGIFGVIAALVWLKYDKKLTIK
ncbi:MAG: hypothetical protein ISS81_04825 [Candidatus Marinimicrobia bacterium]|nr:hypothetical protein [Candidatus Neomarinimicrobiota bacterium]